jgi:hypothetical protein
VVEIATKETLRKDTPQERAGSDFVNPRVTCRPSSCICKSACEFAIDTKSYRVLSHRSEGQSNKRLLLAHDNVLSVGSQVLGASGDRSASRLISLSVSSKRPATDHGTTFGEEYEGWQAGYHSRRHKLQSLAEIRQPCAGCDGKLTCQFVMLLLLCT